MDLVHGTSDTIGGFTMRLVALHCVDLKNGKIENLLDFTGAFYCKYNTFTHDA